MIATFLVLPRDLVKLKFTRAVPFVSRLNNRKCLKFLHLTDFDAGIRRDSQDISRDRSSSVDVRTPKPGKQLFSDTLISRYEFADLADAA
jgi:hypothetical protein